ncbi:MAG: DUF962 domain-containing protein, partial [Bacteroidia bacterium]
MKSIQQWLDEYAVSHQNKTNKLIHWICVPSIFFSIVCLLNEVNLYGGITLAIPILIAALVFYIRISFPLSISLIAFYLICIMGANQLQEFEIPVWQTALSIFVIAWIGQFIGHKIEGKKPFFLDDIQFLL